jgi:exodeoxyribonuclease VII large subunit
VLIVCRGGGSLEDVWSFNEEIVARAIADCPMPVVSGIGHETDFTIADFVADVRAPTPTAAAELVSPDREVQVRQLLQLQARLTRQMDYLLSDRMQKLDYLARRLIHPGDKIRQRKDELAHLQVRLGTSIIRTLEQAKSRLSPLPQRLHRAAEQRIDRQSVVLKNIAQSLEHLNPQNVLERGYSLVLMEDGTLVRSSKQLREGDAVELTFAEGQTEAIVGGRQPRLI